MYMYVVLLKKNSLDLTLFFLNISFFIHDTCSQDKTRSGKTCMRWDVQSPHTHGYVPSEWPNGGLTGHNYCRDPAGKYNNVWCYTTTSTRWEWCDSLPQQYTYASGSAAGGSLLSAETGSNSWSFSQTGVGLLAYTCPENKGNDWLKKGNYICTKSWHATCSASCAKLLCETAGGKWIPLDYSKKPYTCAMPSTLPTKTFVFRACTALACGTSFISDFIGKPDSPASVDVRVVDDNKLALFLSPPRKNGGYDVVSHRFKVGGDVSKKLLPNDFDGLCCGALDGGAASVNIDGNLFFGSGFGTAAQQTFDSISNEDLTDWQSVYLSAKISSTSNLGSYGKYLGLRICTKSNTGEKRGCTTAGFSTFTNEADLGYYFLSGTAVSETAGCPPYYQCPSSSAGVCGEVAGASAYKVTICESGGYGMTHTIKSNRKPVANDALYHCTGKASGGWGVHQAFNHDCTATSPETATKAHMWAPDGHTYGCYFGCSPCEIKWPLNEDLQVCNAVKWGGPSACLTLEDCTKVAEYMGFQLGGGGFAFSGSFGTKGLYAYEKDKGYAGMAFFGTGGNTAQMEQSLSNSQYRLIQYRDIDVTVQLFRNGNTRTWFDHNIGDSGLPTSSPTESSTVTNMGPLLDWAGVSLKC